MTWWSSKQALIVSNTTCGQLQLSWQGRSQLDDRETQTTTCYTCNRLIHNIGKWHFHCIFQQLHNTLENFAMASNSTPAFTHLITNSWQLPCKALPVGAQGNEKLRWSGIWAVNLSVTGRPALPRIIRYTSEVYLIKRPLLKKSAETRFQCAPWWHLIFSIQNASFVWTDF